MPWSPSISAVAGPRSITLIAALWIDRAALELAHVAGEPEHAVRVRAGEIGLQHRAGAGGGVGLGEPAGAQSVGEERSQGGGGDASAVVGLGQHVNDVPGWFRWSGRGSSPRFTA